VAGKHVAAGRFASSVSAILTALGAAVGGERRDCGHGRPVVHARRLRTAFRRRTRAPSDATLQRWRLPRVWPGVKMTLGLPGTSKVAPSADVATGCSVGCEPTVAAARTAQKHKEKRPPELTGAEALRRVFRPPRHARKSQARGVGLVNRPATARSAPQPLRRKPMWSECPWGQDQRPDRAAAPAHRVPVPPVDCLSPCSRADPRSIMVTSPGLPLDQRLESCCCRRIRGCPEHLHDRILSPPDDERPHHVSPPHSTPLPAQPAWLRRAAGSLGRAHAPVTVNPSARALSVAAPARAELGDALEAGAAARPRHLVPPPADACDAVAIGLAGGGVRGVGVHRMPIVDGLLSSRRPRDPCRACR